MAYNETAVPIIREIISNLGGTSDAETVVPALKDLQDLLGEGGISEAVADYLTEHGASVDYSINDSGYVSVVLTGGDDS